MPPALPGDGYLPSVQQGALCGAVAGGDVELFFALDMLLEQSLAQGSRTFEQDLFRLYKDKIITLEEALANSDSPTNLSWLINNAQFGNGGADKAAKPASGIDFETTNPDGSSFSEFTLQLDND